MGALIGTATSTFQTTTGFSLDSVLAWAVTTLYDLFIGSGLAVLYELRVWIVAIVMISALVYFAYRMFQFFRH